jgi:transcriptional regulator with XRE-family HTH domain
MRFHREAFIEILERSDYASKSDFAKRVPMSAGALHDIITLGPDGKPRRSPSPDLIRRIARELRVPLTALIRDPEEAEAVA